MDYLSNSDDTPWTPDLAYYCSVIGRLVDSILLHGIWNCRLETPQNIDSWDEWAVFRLLET